MTTQAYFENIQSHIAQTLQNAQREIIVAVAWFTDYELYQILHQKAKNKVAVSVLLVDDEINRGVNLNWEALRKIDSKIWLVNADNSLMHHKFCVIDGHTVITGSYNWTNKAQRNDENITITQGNPDFAQDFVRAFQNLKEKYIPEEAAIDYATICKRLEILKNTLALADEDDIHYQSEKLRKSLPIPLPETLQAIAAIQNALLHKKYGDAVRLIQDFLMLYQSLTVFIDPEINAMRLEVRSLAWQISTLADERAEVERLLHTFSVRHYQELGAILLEILQFRKQIAEQEAEENPADETAQEKAEEAQQDYEQYEQQYTETPKEHIPELSAEEQKELKSLYRQATKLCHPDMVSEQDQQIAQIVFAALQEAYERNDLEQVREISDELQTRKVFVGKHQSITEKDKLQIEINLLRKRLNELNQALQILRTAESYQTISQITDWDSYFADTKTQLQDELVRLKNQIDNGK